MNHRQKFRILKKTFRLQGVRTISLVHSVLYIYNHDGLEQLGSVRLKKDSNLTFNHDSFACYSFSWTPVLLPPNATKAYHSSVRRSLRCSTLIQILADPDRRWEVVFLAVVWRRDSQPSIPTARG